MTTEQETPNKRLNAAITLLSDTDDERLMTTLGPVIFVELAKRFGESASQDMLDTLFSAPRIRQDTDYVRQVHQSIERRVHRKTTRVQNPSPRKRAKRVAWQSILRPHVGGYGDTLKAGSYTIKKPVEATPLVIQDGIGTYMRRHWGVGVFSADYTSQPDCVTIVVAEDRPHK